LVYERGKHGLDDVGVDLCAKVIVEVVQDFVVCQM